MDVMKEILSRRLTDVKPNKNIHSDIHALADEISTFFGERKLFGRYLGTIKRIGVARARSIFADVKEGKADNPGKLFFWKCRKISKEEEKNTARKAE